MSCGCGGKCGGCGPAKDGQLTATSQTMAMGELAVRLAQFEQAKLFATGDFKPPDMTVKSGDMPVGQFPPPGKAPDTVDVCAEWFKLESRDDRIAFLLKRMVDGGIVINDALGITAVSGMEVNFRWLLPRDPNVMPAKQVTCTCTPPIGFEPGSGNVPSSAWNNPDIKAYLLGQHKRNTTLLVDVGPTTAKWNSKLTQALFSKDILGLFEAMCVERWSELLQSFSVGPTQMFMLGTGMSPANKNVWPGWGSSWEWVWDGYMPKGDPILTSAQRSAAYLHPVAVWPKADGIEEPERKWALQQVGSGNPKLAVDYYEGLGLWVNSSGGLRAKGQIVRAVAKKVGLI